MARKGFDSKWRSWIYSCLVPLSLHFANGSPKGFFSATCSLRQGDLLSPFLFTSVEDAFSQILTIGEEQHLIRGFQVGKKEIAISHLQYADDTLFFLDGEKDQLRNLISLIYCFELVSVMKINWQKKLLGWYKFHIRSSYGDLHSLRLLIHYFPLN